MQFDLFFYLTSSDYTVRDRGAAAGVCLGHFMIKHLDVLHGSVNVHFKLSF